METQAWDLSRALARQGVDVNVITTSIPGCPAAFDDDGVRVMPVNGTPSAKYGSAWWRGSTAALADLLARRPCSVLSVSAGAYGALSLREAHPHVRFVLQAHGTSAMELRSKLSSGRAKAMASAAKNARWVLRDRRNYRRFDHVIAVGPRVRQSLCSWLLRLPPEQVTVVSNGVDSESFKFDASTRRAIRDDLGIDHAAPVVVTASRLHRQKRVDLGIAGFALLGRADPRARYLVVGDGPDLAPLRRLSHRLGIGEKVIFTGLIRREQLSGYLSAADAFLMTSTRAEGLPMTILEAAASGLSAVVPPHLTGLDALSTAVRTADPRSPESVADVLRSVLDSPRKTGSLLPERLTLAHCATAYRQILQL